MPWLPQIDTILDNLAQGEVWAHASAPSELKTTLALNVCYDRIVRGINVFYCSFELSLSDVERRLYALHPVPRPDTINLAHGICAVTTPHEGSAIADLRSEILARGLYPGLVIVDGESQVGPWPPDVDVVQRLKQLGAPVLLLSQIGRRALGGSSDGIYSITSVREGLAHHADVITTTFLGGENRAEHTTLICNLKNRNDQLFTPFKAKVDFSCGRISALGETPVQAPRPVYPTAWERILCDDD